MKPNYFICDFCKINKVELENRLYIRSGNFTVYGVEQGSDVDICPNCIQFKLLAASQSPNHLYHQALRILFNDKTE